MKVNLIPVLEIYRSNESVKSPEKGPFWEYADEYERYNQACLSAAGFPDKMCSYLKGANFYELTEVSDANLLLQIRANLEGYEDDDIIPLDGGYILNIDGQDMLFPQCCSDLGDFSCWENIVDGNSDFWQGHPTPVVSFRDDMLVFDLTAGQREEGFVPPPPAIVFEVDRQVLAEAVEKVRGELMAFADRISTICAENGLGTENMGELLTEAKG